MSTGLVMGAVIAGPEELAQAERVYGRARVIQVGPRGLTAYASSTGRYLGIFDMSRQDVVLVSPPSMEVL